MILGDKIIELRKKQNWTQEEFAEKMNVSRQAVSKWEGAQSIPDIDKLLLMSRIFEVSVDYLIKDELSESDYVEDASKDYRKISLEYAHIFIEDTVIYSKKVARSVSMFILSPLVLVILALNEMDDRFIILGVVFLLLLVVLGVANLILASSKVEQYAYLEKDAFELEYGVEGVLNEAKANYKETYTKGLVVGVSLTILCAIPVILSSVFPVLEVLGIPMLLLILSLAIHIFIIVGMRNGAYEKLLQVGDYSPKANDQKDLSGTVAAVYWTLVTAIYLLVSFVYSAWHMSWIIFAIGGVLFGGISAIVNYVSK